jgi:hypothetical protein
MAANKDIHQFDPFVKISRPSEPGRQRREDAK